MATILIVDDLAANRDVLVTLLRYQGHHLLEASNGREALLLIQARVPDLVITDVLMPEMDGYELVRQLRLEDRTSQIPVVFYTAHYGEREARELALSSGVAHVLIKPVEPANVLSLVDALLSAPDPRDRVAAVPLPPEFEREHLRLLTDKLSETDQGLRRANARLRALVNIGLELASERDGRRLLEQVSVAARDLFAASYVTLGILEPGGNTVRHFISTGLQLGDWTLVGGTVSGLLAKVMRDRWPELGVNPGGDSTLVGFPPGHPRVGAYLVAPMASPSTVYGWICLVRDERNPFEEDDEHLLLALSGQVGRIYENGYLYAVARQERDSAQRYLDTAQVMLLALDENCRVTLINRKGCQILERTEQELLGHDWFETCVPARARAQRSELAAALHVDDGRARIDAVLTRSGRERLIEWRNTPLRDDHGRVRGTFRSGTDVTEQHAAIEALRTAEERMRFALQSAEVGIWDMDYATGSLRWSEMLEAQYGLAPGEFGGTFEEFMSRVHADDRASLMEALAGAMKTGADFSVQNRAVRPDGSVRWLNGAGRILLDAAGTPIRGVGISIDVTARRLLEEQYHQAQKMEAIGRLAGGVAHDFNNLLTAILGYCELLLAERSPSDPGTADIIEIQKAGMSAAALTRQLLAFSRKQIIDPQVIHLNTVVTEMRSMLERLIGEDITVQLRLQHDVWPVVADRGQLEQIVMNLAVNARDAMPVGGTLTIETANVELDEEYSTMHPSVQAGDYIVLTVTDTGTGISPDVQARLFEPFFTTKEQGKGTGLGLATIHGIVTRIGGTVGVYSEVGRGASFKVYLPRMQAAEAPAQVPRRVERRRTGNQTVLVVEDSGGLRELIKRQLEKRGYTPLLAATPEEALQLIEEHPSVDVLLTDVVMPTSSGPELSKRLVELRPSLKVIYMSGYTEDAITHHGVLKPGIAFLHKPFSADALAKKISEVVE